LSDAFAGTVQRARGGLTYGMTALLTTARRPIPLHDAIAKVSGAPFLRIAAAEARRNGSS